MSDLTTNINQAISDFNSIKNAIVNKGVDVPNNTPTSKYGELINNIHNDNAEKYIDDFLEFSDETNGETKISGITDLTLPSEFTLECCFMWESIPNEHGWGRFVQLAYGTDTTKDIVIATHNSFEVKSAVGIEIRIFGKWYGDSSGLGMEHIENNKTYTIALTIRSGAAYFYLNGQLMTTANVSVPSESNVSQISMKNGTGDISEPRYIDGKIYSTRIYRRALSDNELLHNASVDKKFT